MADQPLHRNCGTMPNHYRLLAASESYRQRCSQFENRALALQSGRRAPVRAGTVTIPVVVHVVHGSPTDDIGKAQIDSQIEVLNRDFRAKNPDRAKVPAVWQDLVADCEVEFALASTDPDGNPTDGVTRTPTATQRFSADADDVKAKATGGADPWPADEYLNIWVAREVLSGAQPILGYAQFPGGPPETDGVVIANTCFGTSGTATAPFDLGRTTTHEVGHWLSLRHIWGDDGGGCGGDDLVADTPNQARQNFGTPAFPHISCNNGPNGDMFVNFMDYTDDAAMFMFTAGQSQRISACLEGPRASFLVAADAAVQAVRSTSRASDADALRREVAELRAVLGRISSLATEV
jgi:hypothetical protein